MCVRVCVCVCMCVCVSILHLPAKHVITLASAKVCLPRLCPTRARHSITLLYIAQKRIASKSKNCSVSSVGTLLMQCGNVWPDYHKFSWEYAAKRSRDTSVCVWMPTKSPCAGDIRGRNSGWLHSHCHDFAKALSNRCWLTLEASHIAIPLCNSGIFIWTGAGNVDLDLCIVYGCLWYLIVEGE